MNKQDKELLLKDLCARLPYDDIYGDVYMQIIGESEPFIVNEKPITFDDIKDFINKDGVIFNIKPYLRPMSSMTEEEIKEWDNICVMMRNMPVESIPMIARFVNSKYLDYYNLIPKGLALEAPDGMYNF